MWAPGGRPRVVLDFTIASGKIVAIDLVADPERLSQLEVAILEVTSQQRTSPRGVPAGW
jgi:hypothetical protein